MVSRYPDEVFKDMATSHIIKYKPVQNGTEQPFKKLPKTMKMYTLGQKSDLYKKPFVIESGNCADRCEAIAHSIIDNFKILRTEDRGCPLATSGNHIAMRFFILSHYIADCHMPLHCDCRSFSSGANIHGFIESEWDKEVKKSYRIDTANNRFFYAPDGYPLPDKMSPLIQAVEDEVVNREYLHSWGTGNSNTWDYMSAVSEYSYLMAYRLIPANYKETELTKEMYKASEAYANLEEYSRVILCDAIDSNLGALFYLARMGRCIRKAKGGGKKYTRILIPSFLFIVFADLFFLVLSILEGGIFRGWLAKKE